jgi:hypothetical protein
MPEESEKIYFRIKLVNTDEYLSFNGKVYYGYHTSTSCCADEKENCIYIDNCVWLADMLIFEDNIMQTRYNAYRAHYDFSVCCMYFALPKSSDKLCVVETVCTGKPLLK